MSHMRVFAAGAAVGALAAAATLAAGLSHVIAIAAVELAMEVGAAFQRECGGKRDVA